MKFWICRDRNGQLNIFGEKPFKNKELGYWSREDINSPVFELKSIYLDGEEYPEVFTDISWDEPEPRSIDLKLS